MRQPSSKLNRRKRTISDRTPTYPSKVLLVGNPNSGKTTLFNLLTGLNQKTANYPGVTVEGKSGFFQVYDAQKKPHRIELLDLPGIYSLDPLSEDEVQAVNPIRFYAASPEKDQILLLFVADTNNPARSLHLFFALKDLGFRMALLWNMAYMAHEKGIEPHLESMRRELGDIPVALSDRSRGKTAHRIRELVKAFGQIPSEAKPALPYEAYVRQAGDKQREWFRITDTSSKRTRQSRADRVLMHPVWGPLLFLALMFLIFQSLFSFSAYPMGWIEAGMAALSQTVEETLPLNEFTLLLAEGILPGITGILVFIPQIAFLFLFISLMEESGYLARVTFLADNLMRRFGMNGKSLIPFAGGAACAVPAIMSARTISNPRERLITILVTPFVTCSARLPVFVTLIAVFVPEGKTGIFSTRGLVLAAFYLLGILAVFLAAFVLNLALKKQKRRSLFMMELPDYRLPNAKSVAQVVWDKVKDFVWNAGKIILAISVVLWVLASYGPPAKMQAVNAKYKAMAPGADLKQVPGYKSEKMEQSYAGHFGRVIEPVIRPLGFDWKIGIGLLTSFAAREVFVGTMNTIYGLESDADEKQLSQVLAQQTDAKTGRKMFDTATSLSLMVFFLLAMQCMSTFAVVRRETGSFKTAFLQLCFMTITAYFASLATYQLIRLI